MELTLIFMLSKTKKVFTTRLLVLCSIASLTIILSVAWRIKRLSLLFVPPTWRRNGDFYDLLYRWCSDGCKKYIEDLKINIDDMKMGIIDKGYY